MRIRISKMMEKYYDIPGMLVTVGNGFAFDNDGNYNIDDEQAFMLQKNNIPYVILDK